MLECLSAGASEWTLNACTQDLLKARVVLSGHALRDGVTIGATGENKCRV